MNILSTSGSAANPVEAYAFFTACTITAQRFSMSVLAPSRRAMLVFTPSSSLAYAWSRLMPVTVPTRKFSIMSALT